MENESGDTYAKDKESDAQEFLRGKSLQEQAIDIKPKWQTNL